MEKNYDESPKHASSTSSFEQLDPHDPNLSRLATKMFDKTSQFIRGEFQASLDDYQLLQKMNEVTIGKYQDVGQILNLNLQSSTAEMNSKLEQLSPILKQIDEIDEIVNKLETSALKLDAYSLKLEQKLQQIALQK